MFCGSQIANFESLLSCFEWFNMIFGPAMTKYLLENNVALKISIVYNKRIISMITEIISKLWNMEITLKIKI